MATKSPAAFFSYAHKDDEDANGRIRELGHELEKSYSLLRGATLELFLDRDSIEWGEQWRLRIDQALDSSTFLIPIITPRYFTRNECRNELFSFRDRARNAGLLTLILPIFYVEVDDLSEYSSDEAKALIAGLQYEDWREARKTRPTSHPYNVLIDRAASRLIHIQNEISNA